METKYMCASVFVCVWNDKRVLIKDLSKVALYPDTNSFHLNSKYIPWIFFGCEKRKYVTTACESLVTTVFDTTSLTAISY